MRTTRRRARPAEVVDFQGAARVAAERSALVSRLKAQVERGTYRADPGETARAMERRSDT